MPHITVIGTGYVGLVSGACLADFGNSVVCVDTDEAKISALLQGRIPIYEPGLDDIVARNATVGRLSFTTEAGRAIAEAHVVFIAVGTPPADDGSADLRHVLDAAATIADNMADYTVIVDKSTVPVGTGRMVREAIAGRLAKRGKQIPFDVVSNPEFLREGSAVQDFTHPDRVVIGCDAERARAAMRDVYRSLYINETPFVETNLETAEMIKYAANAYLAVKISFINEIANLCEATGANVQDVARAMGKDGRISPKFLHAGPGYGGSCFPKDTRALARTGEQFGSRIYIVEAAIEANKRQKERMVRKIIAKMGSMEGKTLAVLGLAFKPNTDDMREAPALDILAGLAAEGARFRVFDPAAMKEARWRLADLGEHITWCGDEYEAMHEADALVIMTEWNQFRNLDLETAKTLLKAPVLFDLRNIYKRAEAEARGFVYVGVGQ
jgi:UDPglucose 6-dehydrogenase